MRSPFRRLPPLMERTLRDDVLLALAILVGAALGSLVFGGDAEVLWSFVIGGLAVVVALNVLRFVVRRVGTHRDE
jgi:hypothetical protein